MKNCLYILTLLTINCYGQQLKKVGYTQLANDIFFSDKESISYKNVEFINDLPNNGAEVFVTSYTTPDGPETIYGGFKNYLKLKGAKKDSLGLYYSRCKSIEIEDCRFDNDLRFSNVHFYGYLSLVNNTFPTISEDYVGFYGQTFGGAVLIDSCKFDRRFELLFRREQPYRFFFKFNHTQTNGFHLELQNSTTEILNSKLLTKNQIQIHGNSRINIDSTLLHTGYFELDKIDWIGLFNCTTFDSTNRFSDYPWNAESISLSNNNFNSNISLGFDESKIFFNNNNFRRYLALDFNSIDKSSYVNINSLKNLDFGILSHGDYYNASSQEQIINDVAYKNYLRVNKALYDHFKDVGDIESANETYVRIRQIENVKLGILYDSKPTFQNFFSLNLNRLLKFYTNYGTDPAKALVISFYIIFAFGIFYFFFPSDWDITSKSKLIQNFKDFIEKNDKGYFKPFLTLMLGVIISIINATTLSLNAFTTLGFGNIPTHGLARYICVIQGFIGWFLLSIFTVALINQAQF